MEGLPSKGPFNPIKIFLQVNFKDHDSSFSSHLREVGDVLLDNDGLIKVLFLEKKLD